jgi:16S rRNA (adenine1518-N6/adenine1519-N6)-dimethyltransferase
VKISEIMSTLISLGASPRKSLGQNFLHDKNLACWIVEKLEIEAGDRVLEVGPGLGALTEEILGCGVSTTLLEKDRAFSKYLRERFQSAPVEVVEGDALEYDTRIEFLRRPVKIIGNLPYYLSSALLFHFSAEPCPFERMVFTVQKEMADRLSAVPGNKAYGSLSVIIQREWQVSKLKTLAPSVFLPRPQVDSVVVLLKRREPGDFEVTDPIKFSEVVRTGFSERRKQVKKLLGRFGDSETVEMALRETRLPSTARAEDVSLDQWIKIVNWFEGSPVFGSDPVELLETVDRNDQPLGAVDRATIHRENLLHRAVHIFVLNRRGELLLQKRSYRKDTFPRCWDSSASGHVSAGESYRDCANRELKEELGVEAVLVAMDRIPASARTGHEFIQIFAALHDGPFSWNRYEIETGGFFELNMIDAWIGRRPEDFASGFVECYRSARVALENPSEISSAIGAARHESGIPNESTK